MQYKAFMASLESSAGPPWVELDLRSWVINSSHPGRVELSLLIDMGFILLEKYFSLPSIGGY